MKCVYTRRCAVQLECCINLLHPLRQAEESIILFSGERCEVQLECYINLLHPLHQSEEFIILFSGEIMRT